MLSGLSQNTYYPAVNTFIDKLLSDIANPILGFLTAVAMLYFIVTIIQFFGAYQSGQDVNKLKARLTWGLLGLIIVMSSWVLVNIVYSLSITS